MPLFRLWTVSATQPIPPGEIEAEVAVCLTGNNRKVNSMHVWGYHNKPKQSVHCFGDQNVAVIELRCGIQHHLEANDRHDWWPDQG